MLMLQRMGYTQLDAVLTGGMVRLFRHHMAAAR